MNLTVSEILTSPFTDHLQLAYPMERTGAFLLADRWKMILLHPDGHMQLLWHTTEDDIAYQWRGFYDDRITDPLYEQLKMLSNGFQMVQKQDCLRIAASDLYKSADAMPQLYAAHDGTIIAFKERKISILKTDGEGATEHASSKNKGKALISQTLHPAQDLIVYGTNHGELYAQPFNPNQLGKQIKIDQLPSTCYQIAFSSDGKQLFAGGLGYIRIFDYDGQDFREYTSLATAMRSFAEIGDYLLVSKGIHGVEVFKKSAPMQRLASVDLPFAADKMLLLASQRVILVTSGTTNQWALLMLAE